MCDLPDAGQGPQNLWPFFADGSQHPQRLTTLCVTHEMGFAHQVADRVIFMAQGQIVEQNNAQDFFANPRNERTRDFLSEILAH